VTKAAAALMKNKSPKEIRAMFNIPYDYVGGNKSGGGEEKKTADKKEAKDLAEKFEAKLKVKDGGGDQ
jgi:hypothetical protein